VDTNDPHLLAPGWWETPSGLMMPSTLGDEIAAGSPPDLPPDLLPHPRPVLLHDPTAALDQIHAFVDEDSLGLPRSSFDDVVGYVGGLGFEPAMEEISILAARLSVVGRSPERQLALAELVFGDSPLCEQIKRQLRRHPGRHVLAEQHLYTLMRLLIASAPEEGIATERRESDLVLLRRALLGVSALVGGEVISRFEGDYTEEDRWLPLLIQLGFFYSHPQLMEEASRAELMLEIADSAEARSFESFCPVGEWYQQELGLDVPEQTRLMMAFAAISNAFDGELTKTHIPAEALDNMLHTAGLDGRRAEALAVLSADREEFARMFSELGESRRAMVWETRPFKRKPFLRCENGDLVLLSPRFVESWFAEGFHYRALRIAQERGCGPRYSAFAGRLYEAYAARLMRRSHDQMPGVEVHADLPYRRGPAGKTCDVAVDYATDLVLIEATNSRFRAETLVSGDRDDAIADLERVVVAKCRQLDRCIDRVLAGDAKFPTDLSLVQNVWPVVVSPGVPMQTPPFWNHLLARLPDAFKQARVRPLTLLDPEEFETLCALVEGGTPLPELLAAKTAPSYRFRDLRVWLNDDPRAPRAGARPAMIEEAFDRSTRRVVAAMNFAAG
jgi:hypothetical protein